MSAVSVKKLLDKLHRELSRKGKATRQMMNQTKVHAFSMSVEDNTAQISTQLRNKGYPMDATVAAIIEDSSKNIAEATYIKARKDLMGMTNSFVRGSPTNFTITIKDTVSAVRNIEGKNTRVNLDYFQALRSFYGPSVRSAIGVLNKYYKTIDQNKSLKKIVKTDFLDLGHREGSEVATEQVREANEKLYKSFTNKRTKAGNISANDLKILGIDLTVLKKDGENRDVVYTSLESASVNRNTNEEKAIKKDFLRVIETALKNLKENLQDFEGSDSRVTKEKKRIIKTFEEGIKKDKKVKVKTEPTKVKKSGARKYKKRLNPATALAGTTRMADLGLGAIKPHERKGKRTQAESPIALMALINAKLPQAVRDNMRTPQLVNRTGRFSESVKVVEATQTKKGFPSFGYTYQKNPYQIFEQGAGTVPWANSKRDPRPLIDASIRELAREYLIGRFYTRRV